MGPDGSGHERCGAACLASVLLNEGWQSDPWGLTCQIADEAGITDRGATSQDLLQAAAKYGFTGDTWSQWGDVGAYLASGQAVLVLHNNVHLAPRMYPPSNAFNATHWIRLMALVDNEQMVYTYDPLTYDPHPSGYVYQNPCVYTAESVKQAIRSTPYPEAGIWLQSPSGRNLNG
jgi:hypothetical protein